MINEPIKSVHSEIIICPKCKGNGIKEEHPMAKMLEDVEAAPCDRCNGTGRLLKITRSETTPIKNYFIDALSTNGRRNE